MTDSAKAEDLILRQRARNLHWPAKRWPGRAPVCVCVCVCVRAALALTSRRRASLALCAQLAHFLGRRQAESRPEENGRKMKPEGSGAQCGAAVRRQSARSAPNDYHICQICAARESSATLAQFNLSASLFSLPLSLLCPLLLRHNGAAPKSLLIALGLTGSLPAGQETW